MRRLCFRRVTADICKPLTSVRCLQKPLSHIANEGDTAPCFHPLGSPCSRDTAAPALRVGTAGCPWERLLLGFFSPQQHATADFVMCNTQDWQKQRLQRTANGLPPATGVPACFPDPFRSLQLMRHHDDRGKKQNSKLIAGLQVQVMQACSVPHRPQSREGRFPWENEPGILSGSRI